MDRTKVYPFTVRYPRNASWRKCAQALLSQLKACPTCRGAADGFPVSIFPKAQKLPNGKILIFKGLNPATDQELCTNYDIVEEYDMVSIDPNCPGHGKYSRTAWLRKQGTKSVGSMSCVGATVGPTNQIASRARERFKSAHKPDGVDRPFTVSVSKPLDNSHLLMLNKDVVKKPSRKVVSVFKKRKGENFEPTGCTQIVKPVRKVAAKDLTYMSSILVQKQLNVLCMYNQMKDLVPDRTKSAEKLAIKLSTEERGVRELGPWELSADLTSLKNTSIAISEIRAEVQLTTLMARTGLQAAALISDFVNKVDLREPVGRCSLEMAQMDTLRSRNFGDVAPEETEFGEDLHDPIHAASAVAMATLTNSDVKERSLTSIVHSTAPTQGPNKFRQKREPSTDVHKCPETYASQFRRTCLLKELTKNSDSSDAEVESTGDQDRKLLELVSDMGTEYKMSLPARDCFQRENDPGAEETASSTEGESSTSTPTRFSQEEDQMAISEVFDMEELEQTTERLKRIANTARALQLGLENRPVSEEKPINKVQLIQAQVIDRKEARDWLIDTTMERAINKLPEKSRVRHLVEAYESIKWQSV